MTEHIVNARFHLREARTHLLAMSATDVADIVQGALNRCEALQRAIDKARTLQREADMRRKATRRRGCVPW